jgi:hypothetical protein
MPLSTKYCAAESCVHYISEMTEIGSASGFRDEVPSDEAHFDRIEVSFEGGQIWQLGQISVLADSPAPSAVEFSRRFLRDETVPAASSQSITPWKRFPG